MTWEEYGRQWLRMNTCRFCAGSRMHACGTYSCRPAHEDAEKYLWEMVAKEEVASGRRKYITEMPRDGMGLPGDVDRAWLVEGSGKKELIIRFAPHVPGMQQAAYVKMATRDFPSALPEGARAREWRKGDAETIREGIPRAGRNEEERENGFGAKGDSPDQDSVQNEPA